MALTKIYRKNKESTDKWNEIFYDFFNFQLFHSLFIKEFIIHLKIFLQN